MLVSLPAPSPLASFAAAAGCTLLWGSGWHLGGDLQREEDEEPQIQAAGVSNGAARLSQSPGPALCAAGSPGSPRSGARCFHPPGWAGPRPEAEPTKARQPPAPRSSPVPVTLASVYALVVAPAPQRVGGGGGGALCWGYRRRRRRCCSRARPRPTSSGALGEVGGEQAGPPRCACEGERQQGGQGKARGRRSLPLLWITARRGGEGTGGSRGAPTDRPVPSLLRPPRLLHR